MLQHIPCIICIICADLEFFPFCSFFVCTVVIPFLLQNGLLYRNNQTNTHSIENVPFVTKWHMRSAEQSSVRRWQMQRESKNDAEVQINTGLDAGNLLAAITTIG